MSGAEIDARRSDELGAVDVLMHRGEANPRTRSGIMVAEILDTAPSWERYRRCFEVASRTVVRLRQRVVVPTLPTVAPRWVVDPDFSLDFHVRRLRVPEPGTLRQVLDIAEIAMQSPLDTSRPLWTATLVEGLADGGAVNLLHFSHAVTDGVGGVELFSHIYDLERDPPARRLPPLPVPQDLSPNDLMRAGLGRLPATLLGGLGAAVVGAARTVTAAARRPGSTVGGVVGYARSGARVIGQAAEPSPLLRRRSLASRSEAIDFDLADLHRAAKAADGSVNDAYLAGLAGALRRYHDELGVPVAALPMAVPVNLRATDDAAGGNRFAGINLAAPTGEADPAARIADVRDQMARRRAERALDVIGSVAPVLSVLPTALLAALTDSVIAADVQASNVPVYQGETFIAGAQVLRQYGLGPLPGVAMMAVLVSRGGVCTVTVRYDRAAVTQPDLFERCLKEGFEEVLALAGNPPPQVTAASAPGAPR